jgi:RNA polymerase sigma-70 factor (ECF subfamily)
MQFAPRQIAPPGSPDPPVPTDLAGLYSDWHHDVARWLRAHGARGADLDDLVQDVFVTASDRLADFDGRNPAGWLYRIARLKWLNHRRLSWIRNVMSFRGAPDLDDLHGEDSPAATLEDKQRREVLHRLLGRMKESGRATFYLFEIEGYSGEEIAAIQGIPVNTVWTRLHKARKDFFALLEKHRPPSGDSP